MRLPLGLLLAAVLVTVGLVPSPAASATETAPSTVPEVPVIIAAAPLPDPSVSYSAPANYDQLVAWWQGLEAQYPGYVRMWKANEYYGTGQVPSSSAHPPYDLWFVLVTNLSLPLDRPEVFFDGAPHGDEKTGPVGAYWFVHWWLRFALTPADESEWDPWLRYLLDHREVYFQVNHNPDGFDRGRRGDASGRDLNREADHDGPEAGSGWPDVFTTVNGRTTVAFMNDHQALTGMDFHGGIRGLLIPWGSTRSNVQAVSPTTGRAWDYAPPDYEFYDVFSNRMGDYIGDFGGNYGQYNVGTPFGIVGYSAHGTYLDFGYGSDTAVNPLEAPYVQYGPYPGSSVFWITPEISSQKTPPAGSWGSDSVLGWGMDVRRMLLAMIDFAEPYVSWGPGGAAAQAVVELGATVPLRWQVNGSLVVDSTQVFWGTDPDPVNNPDVIGTPHTNFAGQYAGGTGWDGALDGQLQGHVWSEPWVAPAVGDYYFVARAMVDQRYNATLDVPEYAGADTYLRIVKQRAWDGWTETRNSSTDGNQTIVGRKWWYSPVIHLQVVADLSPPVVTLVSPANNSLIRPGTLARFAVVESNAYTLRGSVDGANWTNIIGLALSTSSWADGHHVLTVNATDSYGNTALTVYEFDVDGTPPAVTLGSPIDGAAIPPGTVLDFAASDANLDAVEWERMAVVSPLPAPYDIDTAGWADGLHSVTVRATDLAGNTATVAATFTIDSDLPLITLVSPMDGSVIRAGTILSIDVTDPTLDSVTVDTGPGPQLATPPLGIDTTGWGDGTRVVTITATDRAGHTSTAAYGFLLDSTPPTITAPGVPPYFAAGLVLDFAVTDANLAAVAWQKGALVAPLSDPYDLDTSSWADRDVTMTVRANDLAGNEATETLSFTVDSAPPTLALVGGTPQILQSTAVLQVEVSDLHLDQVSFLATNATTGGSGGLTSPYGLGVAGWGEGEHLLTLIVTDLAGNRADAAYRIVLDDTPPTLSITPPGGLQGRIDFLLGVVEANPGTASYSVDGVYSPPFSGNLLLGTSAWADGDHRIVLTATDLAGNTATLSATVTLDATAPAGALQDQSGTAGSVTITIDLRDAHPGAMALRYSSGGDVWSSVNLTRGEGDSYAVSLPGLAPGEYSLQVLGTDGAGNPFSSNLATLTVRALPSAPASINPVVITAVLVALAFLFLALLLLRRRRDPNRQIEEAAVSSEDGGGDDDGPGGDNAGDGDDEGT